uniref:Ion_trans_2 domain-containing protein n=1 Tax=Strongyloides venezuelensis TaxID=75913 RepID=A0A0K0FFJ6_STRVS
MEETNKIVQIRLYAYIIAIAIYFSLGVYLIYTLERDASLARRAEYKNRCEDAKLESINRINDYVKNFTKILSLKSTNDSLNDKEIVKNFVALIEKVDNCHRDFNITDVKEIDFWNSISLIYTLGTTLGYGDLYPLTDGGKIFEIFFTLIAIPLVISFYVDLSEAYICFVIDTYYKIKLSIQKKIKRGKLSDVVVAKKIAAGKTKQMPKVYVSVGSLILILMICTANHYYQSYLAGKNDDIVYSLIYVYENFGLIGLGYNVPADTSLYILRELPLMFIGICLYGQYINIMVNTIRNVIPRTIRQYRSNVDKDSKKYTILGYLIFEREDKHMGVLADYRSEGHKKPEIFLPVTVN